MCEDEGFDSYIGYKPRREFLFDYSPSDEHVFALVIDDFLKDKDLELLLYKKIKYKFGEDDEFVYRVYLSFKVSRYLNLNNLPGITDFQNELLLPCKDDNIAMMLRETSHILEDGAHKTSVKSSDLMIYLNFFGQWLNGNVETLVDSRVPFVEYWSTQNKDIVNERAIKKIKRK